MSAHNGVTIDRTRSYNWNPGYALSRKMKKEKPASAGTFPFESDIPTLVHAIF
jgi:hypothetical protein